MINSDDHYIYYCGQECLRRNGIILIVNKRVWSVDLGCNLKNDRKIYVCFQGKQFNITVIQVYAPITNAEEKVERFYEDLQHLLELTPKKNVLLIRGDWNTYVLSRKSRDTWSNRQIWPWSIKWSRAKANRVLPRKCTGYRKHPLQTTIQLQLLQHYWLGHRLGLLWCWVVCLGNKQRSFCYFWDSNQVLHFKLFWWLWWLLQFF